MMALRARLLGRIESKTRCHSTSFPEAILEERRLIKMSGWNRVSDAFSCCHARKENDGVAKTTVAHGQALQDLDYIKIRLDQ